jgi:hypothetical protein
VSNLIITSASMHCRRAHACIAGRAGRSASTVAHCDSLSSVSSAVECAYLSGAFTIGDPLVEWSGRVKVSVSVDAARIGEAAKHPPKLADMQVGAPAALATAESGATRNDAAVVEECTDRAPMGAALRTLVALRRRCARALPEVMPPPQPCKRLYSACAED